MKLNGCHNHDPYGNPQILHGLGYVMTGSHGVIGTDLDHCIKDNKIEPWAQEIIDSMASYTELSPSGAGLRILSLGNIEADWTNHEVGIEIYAGHQPRFLTVTGSRLHTSVHELTDVDPFGSHPTAEVRAQRQAKRGVAAAGFGHRYCPYRSARDGHHPGVADCR